MKLADTMRLTGTPEDLSQTIRARLAETGGHVLVVGVRAGNLPRVLEAHPDVITWYGTGRDMKRPVPRSAVVVLFTRFLDHADSDRIRAEAREVGAFVWPQTLGTGELRRVLASLIAPAPAPAPQQVTIDVPAVVTPPAAAAPEGCPCGQLPWTGSIRDFVVVHLDLSDQEPGWQTREARRLHRLAGQHHASATLHYLQNLISDRVTSRNGDRDEAQLSRERAERAAAAQALQREPVGPEAPEAEALAIVAPASAQTPQATASAIVAGEQRMAAGVAEVLRMLDDATAVLALARETVQQLEAENAQLRTQRTSLRAAVLRAFEGE